MLNVWEIKESHGVELNRETGSETTIV